MGKWGYKKGEEGSDKSKSGSGNYKKEYTVNEDVKTILKYPILPITDRNIGQKCAELYGIRTQVDSNTLKPLAHYFPTFASDRKTVVGFSKRDLTKAKKDSFSTSGDIGLKSQLFGVNTLGEGKFKLFLTEGQFDAACLHSALRAHAAKSGNAKFKDAIPHVASISLGTANALEQLMNNKDLLMQYKEIVLCFDSDKATEAEKAKGIVLGMDAAAEVCLGFPDLKVKYVKFDLNDPCEYAKEGRIRELAELVLFSAQEYSPEELITFQGAEEEIDDLMTPLPRGAKVAFLPKFNAMLGGIRKNEMNVFLSRSGIGKSSLARQMAVDLAKTEDYRICNLFLEESVRSCKQDFVALYHGVKPSAFKTDPNILTKDQVIEARDWMQDKMCFFDGDKAGIISGESVARMIKHAATTGYDMLILDHLSLVVSANSEGNERRMIDNMLTEIATTVRGWPISVWIICHVKRIDNYDKPKEKDEESGMVKVKYPHWQPISLSDGRSSGAIEQLAHSVIGLENEVLDDDGTKGKVRVVIRKNRVYGTTGVCDTLIYSTQTGRLE